MMCSVSYGSQDVKINATRGIFTVGKNNNLRRGAFLVRKSILAVELNNLAPFNGIF